MSYLFQISNNFSNSRKIVNLLPIVSAEIIFTGLASVIVDNISTLSDNLKFAM